MSAATPAPRVPESTRGELRDAVLDAAREVALASGWRSVRMGALAAQAGVSRQTLHAEFGTKAQVASDLVHREIAQLLAGISAALESAPHDPPAAIREAAAYTLSAMEQNPLLQIVIGGGGDEDLLALLTTRGDWILREATQVLRDWARRHLPTLDQERVEQWAEPVVRLTLSHGLTPTRPLPDAVEQLAHVASLLVGLAD
ncbi:TetR family transcriptional regulator [Nocardioides sp.]|uniref:TetR/AcrR family transcriptional regulator n=1 Tax=Nocardioides sp. TaxID=35761 RepID=UPI0035155573